MAHAIPHGHHGPPQGYFFGLLSTPGNILDDDSPREADAGERHDDDVDGPLPLPDDPRPAPRPAPDLPAPKRAWNHNVHRAHFHPKSVPLPPEFRYHFRSALKDNKLVLRKVQPVHLKNLSKSQLKQLLEKTSQVLVRAHWHLGADEAPTKWRILHCFHRRRKAKVNAASALALLMQQRGHPELVRRLVKMRPVDIAQQVGPNAPALFLVDTLQEVIRKLVPEITRQDNHHTNAYALAGAAGTMVQGFLDEQANDDPASIEGAVVHLLARLEQSGFDPTTENLGALAGIIFAGGLKHSRDLRARDVSRWKSINNVILFVSAAVHMLPVFSPIVGAIATTTVLIGITLEKMLKIRDLSEFINELEGKLRLGLLKQEIFVSEHEFTMLTSWIDTMIKCNGLR